MGLQRREKILELLRENSSVTLKELTQIFPEYSSMTLRRDLEFFEKIGEAQKIRGGARYIGKQNAAEDIYELREIKNRQAKERIAELAAEFAETGRSIFIDSGTTGMCLARCLPDVPLSILTSGPNVAVEVSKKFKPAVTLVGGLVNRQTLSVSGMQSLEFIRNFNIDIAFIVASAYSPESGFTGGNSNECELKRSIIAKAKKTIVLVDSAKFSKTMPFTFARPEDINTLITEKEPDGQILQSVKSGGAEVLW